MGDRWHVFTTTISTFLSPVIFPQSAGVKEEKVKKGKKGKEAGRKPPPAKAPQKPSAQEAAMKKLEQQREGEQEGGETGVEVPAAELEDKVQGEIHPPSNLYCLYTTFNHLKCNCLSCLCCRREMMWTRTIQEQK